MQHRREAQSILAEFLCSFIFGYATFSVILNFRLYKTISHTVLGLTIAFSSTALMYACTDIALADFDPSTTFAAIYFNKIGLIKGICYIIAQLAGFVLESAFIAALSSKNYTMILRTIKPARAPPDISVLNLIIYELILTLIQVLITFEISINSRKATRIPLYSNIPYITATKFVPLAIGLTLGFMNFAMPPQSTAVFNPGIVFAPSLKLF